MEHLFEVLTLVALLGVVIFMVDDLFLDLAGIWHRVCPQKIDRDTFQLMERAPQKRIAVLIANWREEEIIEAMVSGNLDRIQYQNYQIILGVYPNDEGTRDAAFRLGRVDPRVRVVVNDRPGPTSKGQLLNHMMKSIALDRTEDSPDAYLLHDSEDIIHPFALKLINFELDDADFVQIPVFSLNTPYKDLTAGTYADEFAESHTKDLLVREAMGAAVPSAGVGTAVSRRLALELMGINRGDFLNEKTLTEDYQLGLTAGRLGFRTRFSCRYIEGPSGVRDYVATREFFPNDWRSSIRQKSRWVTGIAFQGRENLGWGAALRDNYFLWRDRRAPLNSLIIVANTLVLLGFAIHWLVRTKWPEFVESSFLSSVFFLNFSHMSWRMWMRVRHTALIYGWSFACLAPLRWPVANFVNVVASWRAFRSYYDSRRHNRVIAWVKTTHRLPEGFGIKGVKEYAP